MMSALFIAHTLLHVKPPSKRITTRATVDNGEYEKEPSSLINWPIRPGCDPDHQPRAHLGIRWRVRETKRLGIILLSRSPSRVYYFHLLSIVSHIHPQPPRTLWVFAVFLLCFTLLRKHLKNKKYVSDSLLVSVADAVAFTFIIQLYSGRTSAGGCGLKGRSVRKFNSSKLVMIELGEMRD